MINPVYTSSHEKTSDTVSIPEDALVVRGNFGSFSIFALDRGDKETPTNRLIKNSNVVVLPATQPLSLKGRLKPHLEGTIGGSIIQRMLRPKEMAFVWQVPTELDISSLTVSDKKASPVEPVQEALREISFALISLIDTERLRRYALDALELEDIDHAAAFLRPVPEWEILHGESAQDAQRETLGALSRWADIQLEDIVAILGAKTVELHQSLDTLPEEIHDPERNLRSALRSYHDLRFVVKPRFRAVSKLVEDAALRHGIPALEDAGDTAPTLWLSGAPSGYSQTLEALLISGLSLVDNAGNEVARVTVDLNERWVSWPSRPKQLARSWHITSCPALEKSIEKKQVGGICSESKEQLTSRIARSTEWIAYVIEHFEENRENGLNWHRHVETDRQGQVLRPETVRSAALLALAAELLGEPASDAAKLIACSNSIHQMANEVESLISSQLAIAKSFGVVDASIVAIEAPLRAAIAAMRAATPERLAGGKGAVEIMLSALIASSTDDTPANKY
ncbi:MAG: hypothetical protein ABR555_18940 [Pyrinomonadaceae bacterium]